MKHIFLIIATVFITSGLLSAQTKNLDKLRTVELIYFSDLMATGKITNAKGLNFEVELTQVLKGEDPGGAITISKFKNIGSKKRWDKYKEGQEVLLFLTKDGDKYKIMGSGGEGEQLIVGEDAYMDARGTGMMNRMSYFTVEGKRFYAEKLPKKDLLDALANYSPLYELAYVTVTPRKNGQDMESYEAVTAKQVGTDEAVYEYSLKSELHEKLIQITNRLIKDSTLEEE